MKAHWCRTSPEKKTQKKQIQINFDILLLQTAIRSYFNSVTVFHKDELSLHVFLSTETLFLKGVTLTMTTNQRSARKLNKVILIMICIAKSERALARASGSPTEALRPRRQRRSRAAVETRVDSV